MSKEKFKIKPKVWPKEYTFEEFKRLNSNISETLLINYYNQYLQEYSENYSRHINHFNNTKDNLGKELLNLKESTGKFGENADGDGNVGATGAGRYYRSPMDHIKKSVYFDGVDDAIMLNYSEEGREPADGTLKPYRGISVAAWVDFSKVREETDINKYFFIAAAADSQTGWQLYFQNYRLLWGVCHDDGDNTGTFKFTQTHYKQLTLPTKQLYKPSGWYYVVGTWDGKKQHLYVDGNITTDSGTTSSPTYNNTDCTWDVTDDYAVGATDYQTTSGSLGALYYANHLTSAYLQNNHMVNVVVGARADTNSDGSFNENLQFFNGPIAEVAIWDKALDATTISEIYHNNVSGSGGKFDLSYSGGDHDLNDEGLDYKNIGRYANNLQGWWILEEGTGSTTQDLSGKNRKGSLWNSPTWSGSSGITS